jgi:hypothetical protein
VGATQLKEEFQEALLKGLPFPILTVAEYLSLDGQYSSARFIKQEPIL